MAKLYLIALDLSDALGYYYYTTTKKLSSLCGIEDLGKKIPPHITIVPPFKPINEDEVHTFLSEESSNSSPVTVRLGGIDSFKRSTVFQKVELDHPGSCLVSRVREDFTRHVQLSDMRSIRDQLSSALVPHVSLARKLNEKKYTCVVNTLNQDPPPRQITKIAVVSLFTKESDTPWSQRATFLLS